jgi:hypothetical protein
VDDSKWLKEAIDKLDVKVDRLDQRLDEMKELHMKNTSSLDEHILRTEINEENIALLREEIKPIQNHVIMIHGVLKVIGTLSTILGIIVGAVKVLQIFIN